MNEINGEFEYVTSLRKQFAQSVDGTITNHIHPVNADSDASMHSNDLKFDENANI